MASKRHQKLISNFLYTTYLSQQLTCNIICIFYMQIPDIKHRQYAVALGINGPFNNTTWLNKVADILLSTLSFTFSALAIMLSHHQNMHVFADGRKNMNDIFNNYVCSASHMRPGLHFQNVWREPWFWVNMFIFLLKFHYTLFLMVQFSWQTVSQLWFR